MPRGADTDAPALEADWEQYFALELDDTTGAFTVTLNADGTRLLRAFRDDSATGSEPRPPGRHHDDGAAHPAPDA